jgi:poly-gamma-glutamate synthesis protein (capsule biosynthesis protein)
MFVGDISLGEHFFSFGHGPRSLVESGKYIFSSVDKVFAEADFVVGNLEGPLSDINYTPTDPLSRVFRGAPCSTAQLSQAGINVLNIANNHSLQHGDDCFRDTVSRLQEAGIRVIGLTDNGKHGSGQILVDKTGTTLGLVAASSTPDNVDPEQKSYNRFDIDTLCSRVQSLAKKCVIVAVVLHWGVEGHTKAGEDQKQTARRLFNAGAKIIVGHHPHVFFEIEKSDNGLIAYSLGDFVFDLPWESKLVKSGILDIRVGSEGSVDGVAIWPIKLDINGIPKVNGGPVPIRQNGLFTLYRHGNGLRLQPLKKLIFLLLFLLKGATFTKLKFLAWKTRKFTGVLNE